MVALLQNCLPDQIIPAAVTLFKAVSGKVERHFTPERERPSIFDRLDQCLRTLQHIEFFIRTDPKTEDQLLIRIFNSRLKPNAVSLFSLGSFLFRRRDSCVSIPPPETVQQLPRLLVRSIPPGLALQFLNRQNQQCEAVLTDLHLFPAEVIAVVSLTAVDRAAHAVDPVPRDRDPSRIIAVLPKISRGNQSLSGRFPLVGIAVLDLNVLKLLIFQQLLRLLPVVRINIEISGESLRHIIPVFVRIGCFGKGCDLHVAVSGQCRFFLAPRARSFPGYNFIECCRHVFAAVPILCIGTFTGHPFNRISLNPDLHLIFLGSFHGGIVEIPILDQGANFILFIILPSLLQDRRGKEMLPLEHGYSASSFFTSSCNALARWLIAFFSSGESSAVVQPRSGRMNSGS